jgi:hypothetical protein
MVVAQLNVFVSEHIIEKCLYFHVSPFLATLSDCHCKITWSLLAKFNKIPCNSQKSATLEQKNLQIYLK